MKELKPSEFVMDVQKALIVSNMPNQTKADFKSAMTTYDVFEKAGDVRFKQFRNTKYNPAFRQQIDHIMVTDAPNLIALGSKKVNSQQNPDK